MGFAAVPCHRQINFLGRNQKEQVACERYKVWTLDTGLMSHYVHCYVCAMLLHHVVLVNIEWLLPLQQV